MGYVMRSPLEFVFVLLFSALLARAIQAGASALRNRKSERAVTERIRVKYGSQSASARESAVGDRIRQSRLSKFPPS